MFERQVSYPAAYTHSEAGRDNPEVMLALKWLVEQQQSLGGEILVLASALRVLERSRLVRGYRQSLRCMSEATFKKKSYEWEGGPALALWPTSKMMDLLDDHHGTKSVAAVPWQLEEIEPWIRARRPIDLLGFAEQRPTPSIGDPVVLVALEHLTHSVNLGTGLTHPSDRAHAVATFTVLLNGGHKWNPTEIHAWALVNGWDSQGAADLCKIAEGIQHGRRFRTETYGLSSAALGHWREEASSKGSD